VDQQLQKLIQQLGDAINESLSDSESIAEVMARIKSNGYDVFLVLEATIGFNRRDDEAEHEPSTQAAGEPDLRMNSQDVKFLKSLRISIQNDKAA
jgi:uncharacterized protein (UPF0335 family)